MHKKNFLKETLDSSNLPFSEKLEICKESSNSFVLEARVYPLETYS